MVLSSSMGSSVLCSIQQRQSHVTRSGKPGRSLYYFVMPCQLVFIFLAALHSQLSLTSPYNKRGMTCENRCNITRITTPRARYIDISLHLIHANIGVGWVSLVFVPLVQLFSTDRSQQCGCSKQLLIPLSVSAFVSCPICFLICPAPKQTDPLSSQIPLSLSLSPLSLCLRVMSHLLSDLPNTKTNRVGRTK